MRLAVVGANGRMGQEILLAVKGKKEVKQLIGVVRQGVATGYHRTAVGLSQQLANESDLLIDFSLAKSFDKVLLFCKKNKLPLVSGVTGLSERQQKKLKLAAKVIPILWSPNMSLGVATLRKALRSLQSMQDYDAQIIEWHHRNKKDSPSGTAVVMHNDLKQLKLKSLAKPVGIRGGGIFGTHKVYFMSNDETLVFEHKANGRSVFATGAVKAALWLAKRKPGLYTMEDVLI